MNKYVENNILCQVGGSQRANSCEPTIDVYEFLIHGNTKGEYKLHPIKSIMGNISVKTGGTLLHSIDVISDDSDKIIPNLPTDFNIENTKINEIIYFFYTVYLNKSVRGKNTLQSFWGREVNCDYFIMLIKSIAKQKKIFLMDRLDSKHTYIQKVSVDKDTHTVVIGDIHGSFHSFFRILLRLARFGILNLETFELKDNARLIFLGDVVDRGFYCMEILLLIFLLIKNNSNKVFYNRGNHEELQINFTNGFWSEVSSKISEINLAKKIFKMINDYYTLCPSAIIVECQGKQVYLCHGGFSKHQKNLRIEFGDSDIFLLSDRKKNKDKSLQTGVFTRWSDFAVKCGYVITNDKVSEQPTNSCIDRGFGSCSCIYPEDLEHFLRENSEIYGIVRGHTDNLGSNLIFSNLIDRTDYYSSSALRLTNYENLLSKNGIFYNESLKGCICRINLSDFKNSSYKINLKEKGKYIYPVLTTSTNTDYMRNLNTDGFVMIRFDILDATKFNTSYGYDENKLVNIDIMSLFGKHSTCTSN